MNSMNKFVNNRLLYLDNCRVTIKRDREKAEKEIDEYFDRIFEDFKNLKAKKIDYRIL